MKYPAYKDYKYSGVDWIGEIPFSWEMWKINHFSHYIGSGTTPDTGVDGNYGGDTLWVTTGELRENVITDTQKKVSSLALLKYSSLRLHPAGAVAIAMYGATIGRLGILGVDATTNQACCVFPPSKIMHSKYLFYWLLGVRKEIINLASGGGQPNINQEKLSSLRVSAPKYYEQTQIATFLNRETAKIDRLIEKQQRLIKLLEEKRQAVISHAVTKGLNPDVPMKDSGIEWLGDVPDHWDLWKIAHACEYIASGTTPKTDSDKYYNGDILWVTTGELRESVITKTKKNVTKQALVDMPTLRLHPAGSIAIAMYGATIGRLGILGTSATTNQACCVMPPSKVLHNKFLFYWLLAMKREIINLSSGGGQPNVNQEKIASLKVSAPGYEEQTQVASFLDSEIAKFDKLRIKAKRMIDLLNERRTALISAAVTGKIDVRHPASHPSGEHSSSKSSIHADL